MWHCYWDSVIINLEYHFVKYVRAFSHKDKEHTYISSETEKHTMSSPDIWTGQKRVCHEKAVWKMLHTLVFINPTSIGKILILSKESIFLLACSFSFSYGMSISGHFHCEIEVVKELIRVFLTMHRAILPSLALLWIWHVYKKVFKTHNYVWIGSLVFIARSEYVLLKWIILIMLMIIF